MRLFWLAGLVCLLGVRITLAAPVVFAVEDDWLPYSGRNAEGGSEGLTVDLVREVFAVRGIDVRFESFPYVRCMAMARTSRYAGCFNTQRSKSYESHYLYSAYPLIHGVINIYGRRADYRRDLQVADLQNHQVAIANGYTFGKAFDNNPKIIKDESTTELLALRKVQVGRVPYAVAWEGTANRILAQNPALARDLAVVGKLPEGRVFLSFSKRYPDIKSLIHEYDLGVQQLQKSGRIRQLENHWLDGDRHFMLMK